MNPNETPANPHQENADSQPIPIHDRVVLWMFVIGFALFGLVLIGDLISGFFR